MKKHVLTMAAVLASSSFAMAKGPSQSAVDMSFKGSTSTLEKLESASQTSIKFSGQVEDGIEGIRKAVQGEATQQLRKGGVLHSAYGSTLAVGGFSIQAVEFVSAGVNEVVEFVLEGAASGSRYSIKITQPAATSSARAVDRTGRRIFQVGKGVVVGVSKSGVVMIRASNTSIDKTLDGDFGGSSTTIFGSVSAASQAFGSSVVDGFSN